MSTSHIWHRVKVCHQKQLSEGQLDALMASLARYMAAGAAGRLLDWVSGNCGYKLDEDSALRAALEVYQEYVLVPVILDSMLPDGGEPFMRRVTRIVRDQFKQYEFSVIE